MNEYLTAAASELHKARDDNDARIAKIPRLRADAKNAHADREERETRAERLRIAEGFIALAAIEAGRLVDFGYHPVRPEPGQETS